MAGETFRNISPPASYSIDFRRRGAGQHARVEVFVDGESLASLWTRAIGRVDDFDERGTGASALWVRQVGPGFKWWGPEGQVEPRGRLAGEVPPGYAPVLTCTCGEFGCGGLMAIVTFERRVVIWEDFRTATCFDPGPIGRLVFNRRQYEASRRAAAAG